MAEGNKKSVRRPRRKKPGEKDDAKKKATSALAAFWTKRKGAIVGAALGVAAAAVISLAIVVLFFGRSRAPSRAVPVVDVDWPAGLDADAAADRLAALGLVSDAHAMSVFLKATGGTRDFVPGPHLLPTGASPWELKRLLARSLFRPSAKIVVPEGFNRFDIAARLEKQKVASRRAFLAASSDPALLRELHLDGTTDPALAPESAEGCLFPATYDFALDTDPREIVRTLVAAFEKRWAALASQHADGLVSLDTSLGFKRREIVILASILEKEAAVDDERPIIASVFYNRLLDPAFKPKRLQSDPTSAYGCFSLGADEVPSCKGWSGKPTPAINKDPKNRYSTYVHNGLPPGPISNPGTRSIEAAMAPASSKYLYFVAAGNGRHAFSETLDAHNDAVTRGRTP
jgi:UPF0755 protein